MICSFKKSSFGKNTGISSYPFKLNKQFIPWACALRSDAFSSDSSTPAFSHLSFLQMRFPLLCIVDSPPPHLSPIYFSMYFLNSKDKQLKKMKRCLFEFIKIKFEKNLIVRCLFIKQIWWISMLISKFFARNCVSRNCVRQTTK